MADWLISSPHNERWNCRLADCDEQHARSVLQNLEDDPSCPSGCELKEIVFESDPVVWDLPESIPEPEPKPETAAAKRLRLFRRK